MNVEREKLILKKILKDKRVTVKELAQSLYVSEPSVRRDLASLEKQNLIKRIHGGAIIENHSASYLKIPFAIREMEDFDAKCIIAQKASELVKDGDVIMLDASSSAYAIIPYLTERNNITVITCGVKALIQLGEYGITAYSTGGRLLPSCMSLVDSDAMRTISEYNADIVFFSCRGISPDGNITDFSIEENLIRREMIKHSKKSVLLCASEKLNKTYMHNLCSINDIDLIISEVDFPETMLSDI